MYKNIAITKVVYVSGMNYKTTENDLRNFFSTCGIIKNIRFLYDKNEVATGAAYVAFDSHEAALKAYAKDDMCLRDRFMKVSLNRIEAIEELMTKEDTTTKTEQKEEKSRDDDSTNQNKNDNKDVKDLKFLKSEKSEIKKRKSKEDSDDDRYRHYHKHHKHHRHKRHHHHHKKKSSSSSSSSDVRYYSELPE